MINIQIRGFNVTSNFGSLSVEEVNKMLDEVALKKTSLAELILNSHFEKNWLEFNDLGSYQHPLISGDLELIVTGFDDKDYYGDGYSFYREKVENLIQTPVFRNFDMQKSDFIISNSATYYGCVFETELDQLDYKYFNSDHFSITSINTPFTSKPLINELFFNRLPLTDLKRSKVQMVKFKTTILKNNINYKNNIIDEENSQYLKYFIESEKMF
tara:strand:- start:893 stop:1534 length:642 start_codon:yes stop_codon:yes gene_type:complete